MITNNMASGYVQCTLWPANNKILTTTATAFNVTKSDKNYKILIKAQENVASSLNT